MKYELIIVRFGEIALKGKETRKRFENTLVSNIKNAFSAENLSSKIKKEWGRIYVYTTQINKCVDVLQKIFGIISISPALQTTSDMDSMSKLAVDVSKEELNKKKSFAIRATRTGNHDFSSQDVAIKIGDEVVKATKASVDLTNPDFELFIEIRNVKAFLFIEKICCVGGMPLGTQGNILALIDSSESILAAWYLMKRGCKPILLKTEGLDGKISKSFIENWYVKSDILEVDNKSNILENINKISNKYDCNAIVTGHNLNSQETISDIKQLKKDIQLPILTPLIAMNEKEINNKCKEIGLTV